jgi:AmmeMemoRadiSam system protein B
MPIRGLMRVAGRHGLLACTLDLRNSGDTAGPRNQVVGYGAFAFEEAAG